MTLKERMERLENVVSKHLEESGAIQANLKWNTIVTVAILTALVGKIMADFWRR